MIAAILLIGTIAAPMQTADAFFMSPAGYASCGPRSIGEFGVGSRGGMPFGGGHGFPFPGYAHFYRSFPHPAGRD
uniref:Uncharacterized protein n=1 Tax=Candidatus Kentrum sp. TUN TaxID=2126343 RepID=A0A450ZPK5_9GAMM|nr:MAG: hypothetical protein BECKTUN1418D_GA0071000_10373 [Candidatus Kentron sp. TUN]